MTPLLLAGFSAFPGAPRNPTATLARALDGAAIRPGATVRGLVLDVAWEGSWPMLRAEVGALRPRAVLLFGLYARAERLRIELVARNRRELGRADARGAFPSGPAIGDGPEELAARLPLAALAAKLRAERVAFEWSRNAGGYLCNDTYYRLALAAPALGIERFGFVHVPLTDEAVDEAVAAGAALPDVFCTIEAAALERAARALLGTLADELAEQGSLAGA